MNCNFFFTLEIKLKKYESVVSQAIIYTSAVELEKVKYEGYISH